MDCVCLGLFSLYMQTILIKWPFIGTGKLSKLFPLIPSGLNLPAVSDTPQNRILWGIRPHRTKSCCISDRTEPSPAGYQTLQNYGQHCVQGPDISPEKVLWGIRPCGTKSCWLLNPGGQLSNKNISTKFETEFEIV
jgi:hypothetical protein